MKNAPGPNPLFDAEPGRRQIRSFVLREGRLTRAQERALQTLWPVYGIRNGHSELRFADLFGRQAPVSVEVGFGDGDALASMAARAPEENFIGVEVHRPGVGSLLMKLHNEGIGNVRVLCADAVGVFESRMPPSSLHGVYLFFPDPWPKKRHHKRRIIQPPFVATVRERLQPGGRFHVATDWENYAEQVMDILEADGGFRNEAGKGQFSRPPPWRPDTRFERRGRKLGHKVWDLIFEKIPT